jgi:hypothetical protein
MLLKYKNYAQAVKIGLDGKTWLMRSLEGNNSGGLTQSSCMQEKPTSKVRRSQGKGWGRTLTEFTIKTFTAERGHDGIACSADKMNSWRSAFGPSTTRIRLDVPENDSPTSGDQPTMPHSHSDSSASVDELRQCGVSVV